MTIQAHLEPKPSPAGDRQVVRRKLRLLTSAHTARGGSAEVLILDLSTSGMLVQSNARLERAEKIEVELPGTGTRQAEVIWTGDSFFGCSFAEPIPPAAVSAALLKGLPGAEPTPAESPVRSGVEPDFASRLGALRSERGWSIEKVAEGLGVTRQAVWYWETGQRVPRPAVFRRVAELFGVSERSLLVDESHAGDMAAPVRELRALIAERLGCDEDKIRIVVEL
jgi:transcriptional regulator with XRE-family HTH domain